MRRPIFYLTQLCIFLLLGATAVFNLYALQYRFGGYDLSPLIDVGWRIVSGQVPNHDFICTFPPSLYLLIATAFKCFGVNWHSIALAGSLLSITFSFLVLRLCSLLRQQIGERGVIFISLIMAGLQMIPLLVIGHPWHSGMSAVIGVYTMLSAYVICTLERKRQWAWLEALGHVTFGITLLIISKPNTAWPTIVICLASILIARLPMWTAVVPLLVGVAIDSYLLASIHTNLLSMMASYLKLNSRFLPKELLIGIVEDPRVAGGLASLIVFVVIAPLVMRLVRYGWIQRYTLAKNYVDFLALGGLLVTGIGFCTDVEIKIVDNLPIVTGFLLFSLHQADNARYKSLLLRSVLTLTLISIFLSATRARMQFVGAWAEDSCGVPNNFEDAFFGDFFGCDIFASLLKEVDAAINSHPGAKVFFGVRMEFLYARHRLASPKDLPLWWDPATSYPNSMEGAIVRAWESHHFDLLVFSHSERIYIPQRILDDIARDYTAIPSGHREDWSVESETLHQGRHLV